jgi:hypothetical protein
MSRKRRVSVLVSAEHYQLLCNFLQHKKIAEGSDDLAQFVEEAIWHFANYRDPVKARLETWRQRAANPYRQDEDDAWLEEEQKWFEKVGVSPNYTPVARRTFVRRQG